MGSNWAIPRDEHLQPPDGPSQDWRPLLDYARTHYANHIGWFLQHKQAGITTLGALGTGEFAVLGIYFAGNLHWIPTVGALVFSCLLAWRFTELSLLSCHKAFKASLEHALLVTKVVWVMGWAGPVDVRRVEAACPAAGDEHLYVKRYLEDATKVSTTKEFVDQGLRSKESTYHAARITLQLMGWAAGVVGVLGIVAVALREFGKV